MSKRILIADDEAHIRRVIEMKLISAGYEVIAVTDAAAALATAPKYLPHLIISDYKMASDMTGVDLIKAVRETVGIADTPIILLTGSVAVMQQLRATLTDVNRVTLMSKPFSPRALVREMQRILGEEEER